MKVEEGRRAENSTERSCRGPKEMRRGMYLAVWSILSSTTMVIYRRLYFVLIRVLHFVIYFHKSSVTIIFYGLIEI